MSDCWVWSGGSGEQLYFNPTSYTGTSSSSAPVCKVPCVLVLFAVITATKHAENLPYGPGPMPGGDAAYFCTDCIATPSDSWTETVACDGSNVDMTIVYQFDSAMSVADRMRQCAASGCNVAFTVSGPGITTASFGSVWWFTDANVLSSTSGSAVSPDDGMWGAGPGVVNGNGQCYGGSSSVNTGFYGFGNCNSGDSNQGSTFYKGPGGSQSCPSLKAWLHASGDSNTLIDTCINDGWCGSSGPSVAYGTRTECATHARDGGYVGYAYEENRVPNNCYIFGAASEYDCARASTGGGYGVNLRWVCCVVADTTTAGECI